MFSLFTATQSKPGFLLQAKRTGGKQAPPAAPAPIVEEEEEYDVSSYEDDDNYSNGNSYGNSSE